MQQLYSRTGVLALILLSFFTANDLAAQCTDNLISPNADLEDATAGAGYYDFDDGAETTSFSISGDTNDGSSQSVRVDDTGNDFRAIARWVETAYVEGSAIELTVEAKSVEAGATYLGIQIEWFTAGGASKIGATEQAFVGTDMSWQTAVLSSTVPSGAGVAQLSVISNRAFLADNFCFAYATPPPPPVADCDGNLLSNGTFETNTVDPFGGGSVTTDAATGSGALQGAGFIGAYGLDGSASAYELRANVKGTGDLFLTVYDAGFTSGGVARAGYPANFANYTPVRVRVNNVPSGNSTAIEINGGLIADDICLLPIPTIPATPPEPAGNIIPDYGFENGTAWFNDGFSCFASQCPELRDTENPVSGSNSFSIIGSTSNALVWNFSNVMPGATYTGSVVARSYGNPGFAQLKIEFQDASGNVVANSGVADFIAGEDYATYTVMTMAPPGSVAGRIFVQKGAGGAIDFDEFSLIEDNSTASSLPATLTGFSGETMDKFNKLEWTTSYEDNTGWFFVERSTNGRDNWHEVAVVEAAGRSDDLQDYAAFDATPFATSYYRIRTDDLDGSEHFSDIVTLRREESAGVSTFPNPFAGRLTVISESDEARDYRLFTALGRVVRSGLLPAGSQRVEINTEDLPRGQYFLRIGEQTVKLTH